MSTAPDAWECSSVLCASSRRVVLAPAIRSRCRPWMMDQRRHPRIPCRYKNLLAQRFCLLSLPTGGAGGISATDPYSPQSIPSGQAPLGQPPRFAVESTNFASYGAFSVGRKLQLRAVALILALLR
jgi:hypothetical protein